MREDARVSGEAQVEQQEARLESLLLEACASQPMPLDAAFWKRMEAKTEAIIDKRLMTRKT